MDKQEIKLSKHSHISVKLGLVSFITIACILSILGYFSFWNISEAIREQYTNKAVSFSLVASSSASTGKALADEAALQDLCENLVKNEPSITEASVFTLKGGSKLIKIAGSSESGAGLLVSPKQKSMLARKGPSLSERRDLSGRQVLEVLAPIHINGKSKAWLSINVDLAPRNEALRRHTSMSLVGTLLAFIALSLLLSLSLKKEIFNPLAKLLEGVRKRASSGAGASRSVGSDDELGELSFELDNIAEELKQSKEENDKLLLELQEKWHEAESKSSTDFLTNLENYRSFQERLDAEINRASRSSAEVSLLFLDIDDFRTFNEENGPLYGDRALVEIARAIKRLVRDYDVVARYSGEEFAVVINETNAEMALAVGERLRQAIAAYEFTTADGSTNLTVSVGVATYPTDATKKELFVAAAEYAMNKAKQQGGDQVVVFQGNDGSSTDDSHRLDQAS